MADKYTCANNFAFDRFFGRIFFFLYQCAAYISKQSCCGTGSRAGLHNCLRNISWTAQRTCHEYAWQRRVYTTQLSQLNKTIGVNFQSQCRGQLLRTCIGLKAN